MERKHIVVDCDDIDSDVVFGDIYKREKNISASLVLLAFRLSLWATIVAHTILRRGRGDIDKM